MAKKNSGVKSSFAKGAGVKKPASGKCPKGYVMKNAKCVKYNPFKDGRTPTSASQTTGP